MNNLEGFCSAFRKKADAVALIEGSDKYVNLKGRVLFYQLKYGVIVRAEVTGLPVQNRECRKGIFAFHIHEGTKCIGNGDEPFPMTHGHYNPHSCPHPYHSGDMPPLFAVNSKALLAFLTDRFTVGEIIGKTVIIHSWPDDFTTQPSGNPGEKIACGIIKRNIG